MKLVIVVYWTFNAQSKSTLGEKNGMIWDPTFCNKKDYCIIVVKKHNYLGSIYFDRTINWHCRNRGLNLAVHAVLEMNSYNIHSSSHQGNHDEPVKRSKSPVNICICFFLCVVRKLVSINQTKSWLQRTCEANTMMKIADLFLLSVSTLFYFVTLSLPM